MCGNNVFRGLLHIVFCHQLIQYPVIQLIHFFPSSQYSSSSSPRPTVKLWKILQVIVVTSSKPRKRDSHYDKLLHIRSSRILLFWVTSRDWVYPVWWDTLIVRLQNHTKVLPVHLFSITDKSRGKGNTKIGVSVLLRDKKVRLENVKASDTPVCTDSYYRAQGHSFIIVYYSVIKRELNRRPIYEYRCDERLKVKDEGSTRLVHTFLNGGLEQPITFLFIINR